MAQSIKQNEPKVFGVGTPNTSKAGHAALLHIPIFKAPQKHSKHATPVVQAVKQNDPKVLGVPARRAILLCSTLPPLSKMRLVSLETRPGLSWPIAVTTIWRTEGEKPRIEANQAHMSQREHIGYTLSETLNPAS